MSGMDVISKCKEQFEAEDVPIPKVIMLTAIEDPRLREACFSQNLVDHFLTKPIKKIEFQQLL